MAAAPRFEPSSVLASRSLLGPAGAAAPAAPPAAAAAATTALAAVGEAFSGETKRAASLAPAITALTLDPMTKLTLLEEQTKQFKKGWDDNKYFCPIITTLTFEDVQHFTSKALLELCFTNIIAIVLQHSSLTLDKLIKLTKFNFTNPPEKKDLIAVFKGILSKVSLSDDQKAELEHTFSNCLNLFETLIYIRKKFGPIIDRPMVQGLPIPSESPIRIRKILDLLEPKWLLYVKSSNSEIAASRHRLVCANWEFVVKYGDEFVKDYTTVGLFLSNKDVLSHAGRICEFTLEFQKLHHLGQTRLAVLRDRVKPGITSSTEHSSLHILNVYFDVLSNSITKLQDNYHQMQALWMGLVFPPGSPPDQFFITCMKRYVSIIANTFNFIANEELDSIFLSYKPGPKADFNRGKSALNSFVGILIQTNSNFHNSLLQLIKKHVYFLNKDKIIKEFCDETFTASSINQTCKEFNKKHPLSSKKEKDYLKTCLTLFAKNCQRLYVEIFNFVIDSSKTFPVADDSKLLRALSFLTIAEDRIKNRLTVMTYTGDSVQSIHLTLITAFTHLSNEVSDPAGLDTYANTVRTEMIKLIDESTSNPTIKARIPSPILLVDLENRLSTFNLFYKIYLNLFSHTILSSDDVAAQAKASDKAHADLILKLDSFEEEDEKAEADRKDLADASGEELEPEEIKPEPSTRSDRKGKPAAAAASAGPTPKKSPTHTVKTITTSPAKAPSVVMSTDPLFLINSIVKRTWIALGIQSFQQLRRMKTRIRIRVADAMIALDQVQNRMTAIFQTSHPTIITYVDGELNRSGYNFHDSFLAAAQLLMKVDQQKLSHNVNESAKTVFGEHAPSTTWTTELQLLGFTDRFAGFHPNVKEGELKASRENSMQKFVELVQTLILILKTHAPNQTSHIEEIAKANAALQTLLAHSPPAAAAPSAALSPAAPTARPVTLITADFFLPFQVKMEASLKNLTAIKAEIEVEIKAGESDSKRLNDLTRALERLVSIEHLLRLASSVPTLFQHLPTADQWHLSYNLLFFATHYAAENTAWLRAIKAGVVILNHDSSSQYINGFGSTLDEAEMATLRQIWDVLTAEMRPMLYLAHIKRLGKPISPLVETLLNLQQLTHFHKEWNEIPREFQGHGGKTVTLEKLQTTFMGDCTALMNLMNALTMKEMPAAIEALTDPDKTP